MNLVKKSFFPGLLVVQKYSGLIYSLIHLLPCSYSWQTNILKLHLQYTEEGLNSELFQNIFLCSLLVSLKQHLDFEENSVT